MRFIDSIKQAIEILRLNVKVILEVAKDKEAKALSF